MELYHLKLLLLKVCCKDATSFKQLKCVNGVEYPTFRDAARARGLVNDSDEWRKCMAEASLSMLPHALRLLLSTIFCNCSPGDPFSLFEEFKHHLIEDYIHKGYSEDHAIFLCVQQLQNECKYNGLDLTTFIPLPLLNDPVVVPIFNTASTDTPPLWPNLNTSQLLAGESILRSLSGIEPNNCFYIDGPGG